MRWSKKLIVVIHEASQVDVKLDRLKEMVREHGLYPSEVRAHQYADRHPEKLETIKHLEECLEAAEQRVRELEKAISDTLAIADEGYSGAAIDCLKAALQEGGSDG